MSPVWDTAVTWHLCVGASVGVVTALALGLAVHLCVDASHIVDVSVWDYTKTVIKIPGTITTLDLLSTPTPFICERDFSPVWNYVTSNRA